MIKVELCRCIRPFNNYFKEDELYMLHPAKSDGTMTAYVSQTQGFRIAPSRLVNTKESYYRLFFVPIAETYLPNYQEVKKLKKKPVSEIYELLQKK